MNFHWEVTHVLNSILALESGEDGVIEMAVLSVSGAGIFGRVCRLGR